MCVSKNTVFPQIPYSKALQKFVEAIHDCGSIVSGDRETTPVELWDNGITDISSECRKRENHRGI